MKFSTNSANLNKALDAVSGAITNKSDKEILNCILLQRQGDLLQLRATDLELTIQHSIPVEFSSSPDADFDLVAVPGEMLMESCRTLPEIPITFEITKSYKVILSHDLGKYDWMGFDGNAFPDLPPIVDPQTLEFSRERIKTGYARVGFAAIKDISRPAMMGIMFEILDGSARIVASDGHRLARCIFTDYEGELDLSSLSPPRVFQQAIRIEGPDKCLIHVGENHICFSFGNTRVVSRLINASFPNYERAIPSENDKILLMERDEILGSVQRVTAFASKNSNQIVLDCRNSEIKVSAWDLDRSSKGAETVSCDYDGKPAEIGFNALYLQDLLKNLASGSHISLAMGTPNRAALLRPSPQTDKIDLTYLLMPVMLNEEDE